MPNPTARPAPRSRTECDDAAQPSLARFRFYAELNDFIAPDRRQREFSLACERHTSVKHVIEALGVPHTEVELILINGVSVGFSERLRADDRVAVYPKFEAIDITPLLRLRAQPLRVPRFIADAHLGALARRLRMAGFDTLYDNARDDDEIERIAECDARIILSRDRELLKRRTITHGCYVHAIDPELQFREILTRLDLANCVRPLALCLDCNVPLAPVAKADVLDALPARVRDRQKRFSHCPDCGRIFWEGSHWRRMRERLALAVAAAGNSQAFDESGEKR